MAPAWKPQWQCPVLMPLAAMSCTAMHYNAAINRHHTTPKPAAVVVGHAVCSVVCGFGNID
jgi:hypothetical protein